MLIFYSTKLPDLKLALLINAYRFFFQWPGQSPKTQKSAMFITKNTTCRSIRGIRDLFSFKDLSPSTKHLGLPLLMSRSKSLAFAEIQLKIERKITGWKTKLLSQARRYMLIKAVASAIPMYGMSSFLLPQSAFKSIDSQF